MVTPADRSSTPSLVTKIKSEAKVAADHRSAPHSSPGVLMDMDNTGGNTRPSVSSKANLLFTETDIKFLTVWRVFGLYFFALS